MTGHEFQNIMLEIFKCKIPCQMVFIDENNNPYNVLTDWKRGILDIRLSYHHDKKVYVDFTNHGIELYASHKLEDLDFILLTKEIGKILINDTTYNEWLKVNKRDYLINNLVTND